MDSSKEVQEYLSQLSTKENIAIKKAKEVLGSSFSVQKSIGFQQWKKELTTN